MIENLAQTTLNSANIAAAGSYYSTQSSIIMGHFGDFTRSPTGRRVIQIPLIRRARSACSPLLLLVLHV